MKNLLFGLSLIIVFSLVACGQKESKKGSVPENVKTAFAQKYTNAQKVKWDMENATEWEAEFKMDGKAYSANFTIEGEWKETEYKIKISELPANIKTVLDSNFVDYKIENAEVSETADGKVFECMLEKEEQDIEVIISDKGVLLKKEVKTEKEEENAKEEKDQDEEND